MPEGAIDYSAEIKDGKNVRSVTCKFCPSVILTPATAEIATLEYDLPLICQKEDADIVETERVSVFWTVDDMYKFHNVGFSNTLNNEKYLICADCDAGPIGYYDLISKKSYVALSRILHK